MQVITVKNKYLLLNTTDMAIEYKQKGTPDPAAGAYGVGSRFSGSLGSGSRVAWHWDNVTTVQQLQIRPAGDDWEWSGAPRHACCATAAA